jgi:protocatechuate 3,4-dioxygenase beta subunit
MDERLTRRDSLVRLAGLVAGVAGAGGAFEGSGPAAVASGAVSCVLTPELTEGPYYLPAKLRRDIRGGRPGVALELRTTVLNASTCRPIKGAVVDIWHCDAGGVYSGYAQGGGGGGGGGGSHEDPTDALRFLRGLQRTNAAGLASFQTIYPGWYQGRTVHVHVKVQLGGSVVHTGQLFFPEAVTDAVYHRAPYSSRPDRSERNTEDSIFVNGGSKGLLKLTRTKSGGYVARITMGVLRG